MFNNACVQQGQSVVFLPVLPRLPILRPPLISGNQAAHKAGFLEYLTLAEYFYNTRLLFDVLFGDVAGNRQLELLALVGLNHKQNPENQAQYTKQAVNQR